MLKFPLAVYEKQLTLYDKELVEFCGEYLPENGEILLLSRFPAPPPVGHERDLQIVWTFVVSRLDGKRAMPTV